MQRDLSNEKLNYPLAMDNWDQLERDAINRVVASNRFTMGEQVKLFESEVAAKFGSRFAVMVNSGSSANLLMPKSTWVRILVTNPISWSPPLVGVPPIRPPTT